MITAILFLAGVVSAYFIGACHGYRDGFEEAERRMDSAFNHGRKL